MQSGQQNRQTAEALRQTMEALQRAEEQMRQAVSGHDATAEQRAAAQLREAQGLLNQMLQQQAGNSVSDLARRAQEIANAQKETAERMKQMYGETGNSRMGEQSSADDGSEAMPEMNDPYSRRFGYGFRRRNWPDEMQPSHQPTEQEKALANEKEKLARQIDQLQHEMQQQADNMAAPQPAASSKLRRALSDAEQKELALRMQKDAEWMRQGFGDRNIGMEDSMTAGLEQLGNELRDAQQALKSGNQPGQNGQNGETAEALNQVRALREELERRAEQSGQNQPGAQRGGQPGQQPGQQTGQQSGQQSSGQTGQEGAYAPLGGNGPAIDRSGVQQTMQQLYGLRAQIDPQDHALYGYIDGALGNLRHLTGAQAGLLDARINQDAVTSLERLEVELNKRLGQQQPEGARTGAPESSPEKYRDAVAEYFKKLSK